MSTADRSFSEVQGQFNVWQQVLKPSVARLAEQYAKQLEREIATTLHALFYPKTLHAAWVESFDLASDHADPIGQEALGEATAWDKEMMRHQVHQAILLAFTAGYRAAREQ